MMFSTPMPVSYTHLDVYKRQGNELLLEVDFHVGKKQLKQILEKVINTHGATQTAEDVYKRQLGSMCCRRTGGNSRKLYVKRDRCPRRRRHTRYEFVTGVQTCALPIL